jgi:hypothetical protein
MATTASDVWSLGGSRFQAVTGRPPYDLGDNVLAGLVKVVHDDPPRLPPEIGPLATVLAATMVKEPERRWTAAQVCAFLDGAPVPPVPDETRLLPPLPPAGAIAPPPPTQAAPAPAAVRSGRRTGLLWPVAAGALVLVLVLGAWLLGRSGARDQPEGQVADPSAGATTAPSTTSPPTSAAQGAPTADGIETFIRDYLATVTSDTRAAYAMLTPSFQQESGGYSDYRSFWAPIRSAKVSQVRADPDALTVSYRVKYDGPGSRPSGDQVQLQLVYEDGRYLISGESSRDGGNRGGASGNQGEDGDEG